MNKEEVLKKARNQKGTDEREESIYLKSYHFAIVSMILICLVLMFMKINASLPYSDIYSVFTMGMAMSYIYSGWKLNKKLNIVLGICWLFLSLLLVYTYYQSI